MVKARPTEIKVVIVGGEKLIGTDFEAYYAMTEKLKDLVKETFPRVRYCDVETWGKKARVSR